MELRGIIADLTQERKGIMLLDAGGDAFDDAQSGILSADARHAYHELLLTTPGIERALSGVIFSPRTFDERTRHGAAFTEILTSKHIRSGVLFDEANDSEKLSEMLRASRSASFAAFIARIHISDGPMTEELRSRMNALAERAKISHAASLAPLLLIDLSPQGVHTAARAEDVLLESLSLLSDALDAYAVDASRVIVGASLAVSGTESPARADADEVAERTLRAATTALPESVGGVVFLVDAQTPEEATEDYNALARREPCPWPITFGVSRTLLAPVLSVWKGREENIAEAQAAFGDRLALLSRADAASYSEAFEES